MSAPQSKLQQKLAEAKARKQAEQQPVKPPEPENPYAHLAPEQDFEPDPFAEILDNLDIIKAYRLWCGKMEPVVRPGQTESIMISCPVPGHKDADPSAWCNTENNTWYCGRCQKGGDAYDLAAWHYNIDGDYKQGRNFGKLRELMADALGYGVKKSPGKKDIPYLRVVPDPTPEPAENVAQDLGVDPALVKPVGVPQLPNVVAGSEKTNEQIDAEMAEVIALGGETEVIFPTLDWRDIVTPDTFLHDYMLSTTADNIAEEYHFWNGLMALGFAGGRDVFLRDSPRVYGNLFVCLLGLSGDGKSRSFRHLRRTLAEALPFNKGHDYPKGVYLTPTPSSAEVLIHHFEHPVYDVNNPKVVADYAPIRGLIEFSEMAELTTKASRLGNALKPTLIDFYDMKDIVSTSSITHGSREARQPYCSVFSSTQPESLKVILRDSDRTSGFLNRWVFASGKSKPQSFFQEDVVELDRPVESLKRIIGWVGFGKEITVSLEAANRMEEFFKAELERAQRSNPMLARLSLLYKKLLLLFAVNECSTVVTEEMAEKVIAMHGYSVASYELTGKRIGADEQTEVYNTLLETIQTLSKNGEGPSVGQLKKAIKNHNFKISMIDQVLKIMERLDEIEVYKIGRAHV